ncbi:Uncharacterised protein [Vibrio cholerae]|nr:Uncharacterised protein [Vibrio cholerae]
MPPSTMPSRITLPELMLVSRAVRPSIRLAMGAPITKMNRPAMNSDAVIGAIMIGTRGWINL